MTHERTCANCGGRGRFRWCYGKTSYCTAWVPITPPTATTCGFVDDLADAVEEVMGKYPNALKMLGDS